MADIVCYDVNGNELEELYQWDTNQKIIVAGIDVHPTPLFHFTNPKTKEACVVSPTIVDETLVADIPNLLLQQAETITLYFYTNNDGAEAYRTTEEIHINVLPRPKPADYEYEDNIDYESVEALAARLEDLIFEYESGAEALQLAKNSIKGVKVQYAKSLSNESPPAYGWDDDAPEVEEGYYVWQRIETTLADDRKLYSSAVCLTGVKGDKGDTGNAGTNGRSIVSVTEYYALSQSGSSSTGLTWSTTVPQMTSQNKYLWNYSVIAFSDSTTSETEKRVIGVYGDTGETGATGASGADGADGTSVTVSSVDISYIASNSSTTTPTGTWSPTPVSVGQGAYLWTRTIITFSDGTTATSYSIARQGVNGTNGANGVNGASSYIHIKYADTASPTDNDMTETPSDYIGICVNTTQADPTTASSYAWSQFKGDDGDQGLPGLDGSDGATYYVHFAYATSSDGQTNFSTSSFSGATYIGVLTNTTQADSTTYSDYEWSLIKGDKGDTGDTGNGISSVTVTYGVSSSPSTQPSSWSSSLPSSISDGDYLWTKTIIDYTDTSVQDTVSYTYARQGEDGSQGEQGVAGTSVTVSSIQYQAGTSATTAPTGTWSNSVVSVAEGQYLWTKTTFSDGNIAYGVAKQGQKGDTGDTGRGITSIEVQYYLSTSSTNQAGGEWATTPPAYISGRYYWVREKITWTSGTSPTYTSPVLANGMNSANQTAAAAQTLAAGKNKVYYSTSQPSVPSGHSYINGDIWIYRNGSEEVMYTFNTSEWVKHEIGTTSILDGSITTDLIAANAVTAAKIASGVLVIGNIANLQTTLNSMDTATSNAAKTATDYITTITGTSGVSVHDANDTNNFVNLNSNGVDIYVGGDKAASYGSSVVIGETGNVQTKIDGDSFDLEKTTTSNNTTTTDNFFHAGYDDNAQMYSGIGTAPFYTFGTRKKKDSSNNDIPVGAYSVAEGQDVIARSLDTHAEGYQTEASAAYAHAEGYQTTANGLYSHAEGHSSTATGSASHAEGYNTSVVGNYGHAEGYGTGVPLNANYAHAEGLNTVASGAKSHAEGDSSVASGEGSHAENVSTASGNYSHAEGGSTASGTESHAEGYSTTAAGDYSHAEGYSSKAYGKRSHAEGGGTAGLSTSSNSSSYGYYAHAEGTGTAKGNYSHAEGYNTTSEGDYSHTEGYSADAYGKRSHAEGGGTTGFSSNPNSDEYGYYAHAEGYGTFARGNYSHAQNLHTIAYSANQTVIGKYNISDNSGEYAFIIGNGTGLLPADRSNALAVDWSGNLYLGGNQMKDFIVDQGTQELTFTCGGTHSSSTTTTVPISWTWRKWNSGVAEAWGNARFWRSGSDYTRIALSSGGGGMVSGAVTGLALPKFTNNGTTTYLFNSGPIPTLMFSNTDLAIMASLAGVSNQTINFYIFSPSTSDYAQGALKVYVVGTWKNLS